MHRKELGKKRLIPSCDRGLGRLLGTGGVCGVIFTNFILAVGLEHDISLLPIATSLTACIPGVARSPLLPEGVRHKTCHHCRALGASFLFTDSIKADAATHGRRLHRRQLGPRFLDPSLGREFTLIAFWLKLQLKP
jgi:hypothetical protein